MLLKPLLRRRSGAFTLAEIMLVVAIIALLAAIAIPTWLRSRKRAQATMIYDDLRLIDAAVDQYALENGKSAGGSVFYTDWRAYLKLNTRLYLSGNDLFGNPYGNQTVDQSPTVPGGAWRALSDVVPTNFWSPYPLGP